MKKIILIAFLFIGMIAEAQVVVPKSTTTFSNVRATGSMTVANKLRVGSTTAPSATLDVTGTFSLSNQSFSVGTTALAGGNTGTIAVLSDAVFPVNLIATNTNLSDGTTYYFGNMPYALATATNVARITLPYNCTLVGWNYNNLFTPGTSESATLSISGTTNYTLSSSITFTNVSNLDNFSGTGLSQNFTAGDVINAKLTCPTYVTNPTFTHHGLTLWFVRRQ